MITDKETIGLVMSRSLLNLERALDEFLETDAESNKFRINRLREYIVV